MILNNVAFAANTIGKPLKASYIQSSDYTAELILSARMFKRGSLKLTLPDPVDALKFPIGMKVLITNSSYNGDYLVEATDGSTLVISKKDFVPSQLNPANSGGEITPIGPAPSFLAKPGTEIKNGAGKVVAITYTGNNSFPLHCIDSGNKLIQVVRTAGNNPAVTIKWSLDGVNFSDFSPAISGTGAVLGFYVQLPEVDCMLKVDVATTGTYYLMEG